MGEFAHLDAVWTHHFESEALATMMELLRPSSSCTFLWCLLFLLKKFKLLPLKFHLEVAKTVFSAGCHDTSVEVSLNIPCQLSNFSFRFI